MFWNKRLQKTLGVSHRTAPCRDPVFPKTKVITVPFGPNGFLKVIFRWRLAYLRFLSVFVCAFVYITFLSFFIIPQWMCSRWTLRFLRKSLHIWKQHYFSYFGYLRLRFLFFNIFVDFRVTLCPPLGQNARFFIVFGFLFWSNLVQFLVNFSSFHFKNCQAINAWRQKAQLINKSTNSNPNILKSMAQQHTRKRLNSI